MAARTDRRTEATSNAASLAAAAAAAAADAAAAAAAVAGMPPPPPAAAPSAAPLPSLPAESETGWWDAIVDADRVLAACSHASVAPARIHDSLADGSVVFECSEATFQEMGVPAALISLAARRFCEIARTLRCATFANLRRAGETHGGGRTWIVLTAEHVARLGTGGHEFGAPRLDASIAQRTRGARIDKDVQLLDSPGIIPASHVEQCAAYHLAICDDIGNAAYDTQGVAAALFERLSRVAAERPAYARAAAEKLHDRWGVPLEGLNGEEYLCALADARFTGNVDRAAGQLLKDYRSGALGRACLELPPEL